MSKSCDHAFKPSLVGLFALCMCPALVVLSLNTASVYHYQMLYMLTWRPSQSPDSLRKLYPALRQTLYFFAAVTF